jgi:hypothetical protein
MSLRTVPPPEGPMPLLYTATCEQCRPRHHWSWEDQHEANTWAADHEAATGHGVTRGTMRGAHT